MTGMCVLFGVNRLKVSDDLKFQSKFKRVS